MGAMKPKYLDQGMLAEVRVVMDKEFEPPAGYNPNIKRMTCPNHGLEWHRYGLYTKAWKCVKC